MKPLLFFAFIVLAYTGLRAQCPNPNCVGTDILNVSTGINAGGSFLSTGSVDPFWKLTNYPPLDLSTFCTPPTVTIPNANVVAPLTGSGVQWLRLNPGGEGILSSNTTSSFGCNNQFTNQPWRFRRSFCVCKDSKVTFAGDVRMDDEGSLNIYNAAGGSALYSLSVPAGHIYVNKSFSTNLSLPAGTYYVEAELLNTNASKCGFVVKASIVETAGQKTLFNSHPACCSNTGFISVQKILETVNCNGQTDAGEMPGAGWAFTLLNSLGGVVQTQTTNSNGEAFFNGLAPGTYTVTEQAQSGWTANIPVGGSQQVVISAATANNGVHLTFYNCQTPPGDFCCDGQNLIQNPSFESGNTGFTSQYAFQSSTAANAVLPGQYGIVNQSQAAAICSQWQAKDHTACTTPGNSKLLIVDGETTQTTNAGNIVWQQTVGGLELQKEYKFCAYMKNLPACCFDVKPRVRVEITPGGTLPWTTINAGSAVCDWQLVELSFTATSASVTIKIYLEETTKGDGNDLAIDDISLQKLPPANVQITVQNQSVSGANCQITASLNTLSNGDDALPSGQNCKYVWVIGKLATLTPVPTFSGVPMLGGNMGNPAWGLTTTFPGFNCQTNQTYLVYLYVYDCDCLATGSDYQITLDNGRTQKLTKVQEEALHAKVMELIRKKLSKP